MKELSVTSPAFEAGGFMPDRFSGYGEDISPELRIDNIDGNAVSLAITLCDLSHPIFPGYCHWVAWNIKPASVIPEGLPAGACVEEPIKIEQGMAYGKHRYKGPRPPFNWNHKYLFTVYALDDMLSLSGDTDKKGLMKAIKGHVLQTGSLLGRYQRRHK